MKDMRAVESTRTDVPDYGRAVLFLSLSQHVLRFSFFLTSPVSISRNAEDAIERWNESTALSGGISRIVFSGVFFSWRVGKRDAHMSSTSDRQNCSDSRVGQARQKCVIVGTMKPNAAEISCTRSLLCSCRGYWSARVIRAALGCLFFVKG